MKIKINKNFIALFVFLSVISYSYQHKLSEPLDNFGYTMCTSLEPSENQYEKGILRVSLNSCSFDRSSYFNNDFSGSLTMGIRVNNIFELKKYLNENNGVLMLKCGIRGYTDFYKVSYMEVQRKDIVITDYNSFLEKYKSKYDDYGCIPK